MYLFCACAQYSFACNRVPCHTHTKQGAKHRHAMRKTHTYQERGQVVSRNCIRNLDPFKTERKGIDSEISSASMKFIKLFTF